MTVVRTNQSGISHCGESGSGKMIRIRIRKTGLMVSCYNLIITLQLFNLLVKLALKWHHFDILSLFLLQILQRHGAASQDDRGYEGAALVRRRRLVPHQGATRRHPCPRQIHRWHLQFRRFPRRGFENKWVSSFFLWEIFTPDKDQLIMMWWRWRCLHSCLSWTVLKRTVTRDVWPQK